MATPDSIGTAECHNCGREVFIRKNAGGFCYYRCERCGVELRHHIMRASEEYLKGEVKMHAAATPPKPAPAAEDPAPKPAPAPAPKPAAAPSLRTLLDQAART